MADLPQFSWPFQYVTQPDGSVGIGEVEQDSDPDLESTAAVIMCTPRGARFDQPDAFGVSQLVFQTGPLDTARLARELAESDERLRLSADEILDLAEAAVRTVRVGPGGF